MLEMPLNNDIDSVRSQYPNEKILRQLGNAELVYDYEIKSNGCVLPFSVLVETSYNLFANLDLIDNAIEHLKAIHPLLGAKIFVPDNDVNSEGSAYFSHERYFALCDEETVRRRENIDYMRVVTDEKNADVIRNYWKLLHQYEFNIRPVNCRTGPLWRLKIVEMLRDERTNLFTYCIVLTAHHAITDGRNMYHLLLQLTDIIEKLANGTFDEAKELIKFEVSPSIEEKLYNNDPVALSTFNLNSDFDVPGNNKIPSSFASYGHEKRLVDLTNTKFVYVNKNRPALTLQCLYDTQGFECVTKFQSFVLNEELFVKLLRRCKEVGAKLTGCLNLICALATQKTYCVYETDENNNALRQLSQKLYYHILGNLRQFLGLGNLNMGYWSIVLNGVVDVDKLGVERDEASFYGKRFWAQAKKESDELHKRIDDNELYENAKLDQLLLNDIDQDVKYEHGAVHFAISNLGNMQPSSPTALIKFKEAYFDTACVPNRWSAIVFHGLTTLETRLCWGIAYNCNLVRDEIVAHLIQSINETIASVVS